MANNYLEFSEQIDNLTPDEQEWWAAEAERIIKALDEGDENGDSDGAYEDVENCNNFEIERDSVWFRSDENGDIEKVAHIVQKFLKAHRPDKCFSLTWAEHCSKLRIGEFGGGAVFVTAKEQKFYSGHMWLNEQMTEWKKTEKERLSNEE